MRPLNVALAMFFLAGTAAPAFSQASASSATSQRMAVPKALHNDVGSLPASAGTDANANNDAADRATPAAGNSGVTRRVRDANKHAVDATGHKVDAAGKPVGQAAETDAESQ